MANTLVTPSIFAKAAVRVLNNELVMANRVYRAYEKEFDKNVNGYKVGQTISIRKPAQFTVRSGNVASIQDVTEGSTSITVGTQKGIDFKLSGVELTMNISDMADRVIRPAMVRLANQIDQDVHSLFTNVWNVVGTPGNAISTFAGFMAGVRRLNEGDVPSDDRAAIISPADHASLLSQQTALFLTGPAGDAYRKGQLGSIAGIDTYMTQNAPVLTTGTRTNGTVAGANQNVTYSGAQANSYTQTLAVAGLGASGTVAAGDVFTIAGVFAVNPVTKAAYSNLQQFTVTAAATADGTGAATVTISPAIISSGAFQTVSATPANAAVVTWSGAANTSFTQNQFIHRNAHALCVVPMELPPGSVGAARESFEGLSVRVVPYYDGTNDVSNWRLDVLYGVRTIDPRLAARVYGA
jgi:hypothetical protein